MMENKFGMLACFTKAVKQVNIPILYTALSHLDITCRPDNLKHRQRLRMDVLQLLKR